MQKAQPPAEVQELLETMERERKDTIAARAEFGFFEAWKRVADRRAHLIFMSLPLDGPAIPDDLREAAIDHIQRLTWPDAFEGMTEEEQTAAWREHGAAMDKYALVLANKTAAEQWKSASAL